MQQRQRAVLLMLGASVCFVGMGAFVKLLREQGASTPEAMVYRMAPSLPWICWALHRRGKRWWPHRPGLVQLRVLFGATAMAMKFYAYKMLTLVQANVLHLAQPVFIAVLAPFVLRERLRGAAVVALALALFGALLVIRPGADVTELALIAGAAGLGAAIFGALAHMMIRRATREDAPETVVLHFALQVSIAATLFGLATGEFAALPDVPPEIFVLELLGVGVLGALAQLLMSHAYERAQAPIVSIVGYAGIPLSVVADLLFWNATAGPIALLGAALMVISGVILLRR